MPLRLFYLADQELKFDEGVKMMAELSEVQDTSIRTPPSCLNAKHQQNKLFWGGGRLRLVFNV